MTDPFLPRDLVRRITGKARGSAQVRQLARQKIRYLTNADGDPVYDADGFPLVYCQQEVAGPSSYAGVDADLARQEAIDRPWKESGQIPDDWFRENFERFILSPEDIAATRRPYHHEDCPRDSGIYFLFSGGKLIYIGKAMCIQNRLIQHQHKRFDEYAWIGQIPALYLGWVESYYIWKFEPVLNFKFDFFPGWMTEE